MDHTLNSVSNLYALAQRDLACEVIMMNEFGLMLPLSLGEHIIQVSKTGEKKKGCGLIAFDKIQVETKGLMYDMGPNHDFKEL